MPHASAVEPRERSRYAWGMRWLVWTALLTAACNRETAHVGVDDAPKSKGSKVELTGGQILFDKGGKYERVCTSKAPTSKGQSGCVDHYFYAFPVVADGADDAKTISAWVTCKKAEKLEACRDELQGRKGAIGGSVAVRVGDEKKALRTQSGWETAIADAVQKHGLVAVEGGPVIRLE